MSHPLNITAEQLQFLGNVLACGLHAFDQDGAEPVQWDSEGIPTAWRLLPAHPVSITKGGKTVALEFTTPDLDAIVAAAHAKGVPIPIDSRHFLYHLAERVGVPEADLVAMLQDKSPAMGFGRLERRDDGLWLTDVEWSDLARDVLREGVYRYYSPVIRGLSDGRLRITSVALTNNPAIDNLDAIAASDDGNMERDTITLSDLQPPPAKHTNSKGTPPRMKNLLAIIGAMIGAQDTIALDADGNPPEDTKSALQDLADALPGFRAAHDTLGKLRDALSLDAEAEPETILGTIAGLVAKGEQHDQLKTQVDTLVAEAESRKRADIIAGGLKAGKLTKAQADGWAASADVAVLTAFLETAPVVVPQGSTPPPPRDADDAIALSDTAKEVARHFGHTEEQIREFKQKQQAAS